MGTAVQLPQELYPLVFEQLRGDTPTLLAIALSSRLLYQESIHLIYHESHPSEPRNICAFLRTVSTSQFLADLVYGWSLYLLSSDEDENKDFFILLATGVVALRNLKQIAIGYRFDDHGIIQGILNSATFQLDGIRWMCMGMSEKAFLCSWLKSHPNLTELHMDIFWRYPASLQVDVASVPSLTRLSGTHATLLSLLPICPTVTEVCWTRAHADGFEANPRVLASLKQLRKLVFAWERQRIRLRPIAAYLTHLEVLEVMHYQDEYYDDSVCGLIEDVTNTISKLRWVVLRCTYLANRTLDTISSAIFQSNSNVRYVSIENYTNPRRDGKHEFMHYQRGLATGSHVMFATKAMTRSWFWGFEDEKYLQDEWDGL